MKLHYTAMATAVACALVQPVVYAQDKKTSQTLDTIEVIGTESQPAMSPVDANPSTFGRESADILRDIPGVSGSRMGGHGTDPSIRGLNQNRINVLLDGAYVHGGCPNRMDPPTSYAPVGAYEQITVIKGMQTLEYGGGGPGGTILFERETARFTAEESMRGHVEAGYRSNHDAWEAGGDVATGNENGFVRFIGSHTDADSYEDGNGNEVRSAYEATAGTLIAGYTPSDATRFEVSVEQQKTRDLLFPGAGMDSPKADNDTVRAKYQTKESLGVFENVKAEVYRADVDHVMDNYTLRTLTAAAQMRAPSTSETIGGRVVGEMDTGLGRWKLGMDIQNNERNAERYNDTAGILNSVMWPGVEIDQAGIFAELTHQLDAKKRLVTGLRYDRVESNATRADTDPTRS